MSKDYLLRLTAWLKNYNIAIIYIVVTGFVLRILWALLISPDPVSDSFAYATFARNIAEFGVYGWTSEQASAFWPVGTSAIYAFLFYLFGDSYVPIVVFNIFISTGIIVLAMRVSRRFFGAQVASLTGIILALWPSLIFYVTILASELPFMFLILAAIDVWSNPKHSITLSAILAGIFIAGASYIRPIALLLPFIFGITFAFYTKNWRRELLKTIIVSLLMVVLILPWSVRNYHEFGHVIVISTNGSVTLWMGNHPGSDGAYAKIPDWANSMNEYDRSKIMGERAIEYIKAEPIAFVTRSIKKFIYQHSYETIAITWNKGGIIKTFGEWAILPLKALCQAYWLAILFFSFIGVVLAFRNLGFLETALHPILVPWLYFSAISAIIVAQDRYHFPAIPFIAIFSAYAIHNLLTLYQEKSLRKQNVE